MRWWLWTQYHLLIWIQWRESIPNEKLHRYPYGSSAVSLCNHLPKSWLHSKSFFQTFSPACCCDSLSFCLLLLQSQAFHTSLLFWNGSSDFPKSHYYSPSHTDLVSQGHPCPFSSFSLSFFSHGLILLVFLSHPHRSYCRLFFIFSVLNYLIQDCSSLFLTII